MWRVTKKNDIFSNNFIKLIEKQSVHPQLGAHNFYCVNFPDWVNIVALTKNNEIILVKQYRHGLDDYTLEVPGGVVDLGENPLDTAERELLEETGFKGRLKLLGKIAPNPAIQNNFCHIYCAEECMEVSQQSLDTTEDIDVIFLPLKEIDYYLSSGKIIHSLSIASILMALREQNKSNF